MVLTETTTLLDNIEDPTGAGNIGLLSNAKGKEAVEAFLVQRTLPEPVDAVFIQALQEVLSGLEKVVLTEEQLRAALTSGGIPCTVNELKERFDGFVTELTKGKVVSKVRFVVQKESSMQQRVQDAAHTVGAEQ